MSDDRKRKCPYDSEDHRAMSRTGTPASRFVSNLAPNDVLFGRGAPIIRWSGNVKFRELVRERKQEYLATRRHAEKESIALAIIEEIQNRRGGRFLKRVESSTSIGDLMAGIPHQWMLAEEGLVIEKVKQALRDKESEDTKRSAKKSGSKEKDPVAASTGRNHSGLAQPNTFQGFATLPEPRRQIISGPVSTTSGHIDAQQGGLQQSSRGQDLGTLLQLVTGHGQSGNALGQLPTGQMPGFSIPNHSATFLPSLNALLQLQAIGQGIQAPQPLFAHQPQMPRLHPTATDPISALAAYLQAMQQEHAHRQTLVRILQDTIRSSETLPSPVASVVPRLQPQRDGQLSSLVASIVAAMNNRRRQSQVSSSSEEKERNIDEGGS